MERNEQETFTAGGYNCNVLRRTQAPCLRCLHLCLELETAPRDKRRVICENRLKKKEEKSGEWTSFLWHKDTNGDL